MQFRRSGQGDERRRRVFRDEMLTATDREAGPPDDSLPSRDGANHRVYSDAAAAQHQSPLTSLLPQRVITLVALLFGGGLAIAAIELLYARFFVRLPDPFQASLAVFDLTARGNIASWFASLTLLLGASVSMLVYLIRRHRLDDYRGRYRIWQWAAVLFVLASFDVSTGAHAVSQPAMVQLTGSANLLEGLADYGVDWSLLLVGLAVAICFVRLAIEIRGSRLATAFLFLSAGSYVGSIVTNFHPAIRTTELVRIVASSSTILAAHFGLLYAVVLYGRHVYQEAQGTRRPRRARVAKADEGQSKKVRTTARRKAGATRAKNVRVDAAHDKPPAESTPAGISKKSVQKTVSAREESSSHDGDRSLSKAERRRLRKLERRQRRQGDESDE